MKIVKDDSFSSMKVETILISMILFFSVLTTYLLSTFIGGAFYEFCKNSVLWVLFGIVIVFVLMYRRIRDKE